MKLFTHLDIPKGNSMSYASSIVSMGSCFADNVGRKLAEGRFKIHSNPFGILYNPVSICQALSKIMEQRFFSEEELVQRHGLWHSWMHHGRFSDADSAKVLEQINTSLAEAHNQLKTANFLLITLGSAYIYALRENGFVVANCHKFPSADFIKSRLGVDEICLLFSDFFKQLNHFSPNIQVVFTVSPIRHVRDGIMESQRSKSVLLLAVEQLCTTSNITYFPSYEIMMDELRDYRFYKADMIHPNDVAVDYIWDKFRDTYFDSITENQYQKVLKIVKGFQHKILHPKTKEHQQFLNAQIRKAEQVMAEISVDFSVEIDGFRGQLQLF